VEPFPSVAFFTDSFHEINGVALTSREFQGFARRRQIPFLCVRGAGETRLVQDGPVFSLDLHRSAASFPLDLSLYFDPVLLRHRVRVANALGQARTELIHVTGPGDVGILGALLAHQLNIPLVASWHANLHEFASRRLERWLAWVPENPRHLMTSSAERGSLDGIARFYRLARVLLAPNQDLIDMLRKRTGRPVFLMRRGVDLDLFSPTKRTRTDGKFVIGYVGRLVPEKNVRLLASIEERLIAAGKSNFRFVIVGGGSEREWLAAAMKHVEMPGILAGEALAEAYANMDVFVFPSRADTFGNVVQEAQASGVPAIVSSEGAPRFLLKHGETGFAVSEDSQFTACVLRLMENPGELEPMRIAAREHAGAASWDRVFEGVYSAYRHAFGAAAAG
jgi:glycosyltransferase involved in cell wall biosynthesis